MEMVILDLGESIPETLSKIAVVVRYPLALPLGALDGDAGSLKTC